MRFLFLLFLLITFNLSAQEKINTNNIEIVRDSFGVPHIFTQTDVEAVYGLAWAQCEDNFHIMQENFASVKGLAGRLMGKTGAGLDFLYQIFEIEAFVKERYNKDIDAKMEPFLEAYSTAINQYALKHPKEVKNKNLFPLTPIKILENHTLQMLLLHNSVMDLGKLLSKDFEYETLEDKAGRGSNAMAYSPNITSDGKTYLVGNPHQPVNQMGNFWEVSIHSEEGYEMYGVTFSVGGLFPAIGTNRNLGWSHTTNYQNTSDVYKLEMHPTKKNFYKYDGEWLELEEKTAKLKVKIGPITIPVKKKYYKSVYGPTIKKKSEYFSYKTYIYHNIRLPEQWYKMGLAKNFEEFNEALSIQGLPAQTITYADKDGNIYHLSNFAHPYRDEAFDWSSVLDGTTSANNWNMEKIHPISDLPQIKNPDCGYLYNCNNTVFRMTAPEENLKPDYFPKGFGLLTSNTVRAKTFERLIKNYDKVSFDDVREIRENTSVDKHNLSFRNCMNCDAIPILINERPELKNVRAVFNEWNGSYDIDNKQAPLMALASVYLEKYLVKKIGNIEKDVPEDDLVEVLLQAEQFLMKYYGTLEIPLGKIQKAKRYDVALPMYGSPTTLANAHFEFDKKGKLKLKHGDTFIMYAKYGSDGLEELNTINAFGNSLRENHPHNNDQTEMYVKMQTKPIELDLELLKQSGKAYHPE